MNPLSPGRGFMCEEVWAEFRGVHRGKERIGKGGVTVGSDARDTGDRPHRALCPREQGLCSTASKAALSLAAGGGDQEKTQKPHSTSTELSA